MTILIYLIKTVTSMSHKLRKYSYNFQQTYVHCTRSVVHITCTILHDRPCHHLRSLVFFHSSRSPNSSQGRKGSFVSFFRFLILGRTNMCAYLNVGGICFLFLLSALPCTDESEGEYLNLHRSFLRFSIHYVHRHV